VVPGSWKRHSEGGVTLGGGASSGCGVAASGMPMVVGVGLPAVARRLGEGCTGMGSTLISCLPVASVTFCSKYLEAN
jgi:hypothetical protein